VGTEADGVGTQRSVEVSVTEMLSRTCGAVVASHRAPRPRRIESGSSPMAGAATSLLRNPLFVTRPRCRYSRTGHREMWPGPFDVVTMTSIEPSRNGVMAPVSIGKIDGRYGELIRRAAATSQYEHIAHEEDNLDITDSIKR